MLGTTKKGNILLDGVEIEHTFAEMYRLNEVVSSVLDENPFFPFE